jgi:hypothetical protein
MAKEYMVCSEFQSLVIETPFHNMPNGVAAVSPMFLATAKMLRFEKPQNSGYSPKLTQLKYLCVRKLITLCDRKMSRDGFTNAKSG